MDLKFLLALTAIPSNQNVNTEEKVKRKRTSWFEMVANAHAFQPHNVYSFICNSNCCKHLISLAGFMTFLTWERTEPSFCVTLNRHGSSRPKTIELWIWQILAKLTVRLLWLFVIKEKPSNATLNFAIKTNITITTKRRNRKRRRRWERERKKNHKNSYIRKRCCFAGNERQRECVFAWSWF